MAAIIQPFAIRRDTAANWTAANPILLAGQEGYESDTRKRKVGNGTSTWSALEYDMAESSGGSDRGDIVYVYSGSTFVLAPGQVDDGISPRSYRGGANGAVEAQPGHVARDGDWHLAVNP